MMYSTFLPPTPTFCLRADDTIRGIMICISMYLHTLDIIIMLYLSAIHTSSHSSSHSSLFLIWRGSKYRFSTVVQRLQNDEKRHFFLAVGTYMTLLNTMGNLGGRWPPTAAFFLVDAESSVLIFPIFPFRSCLCWESYQHGLYTLLKFSPMSNANTWENLKIWANMQTAVFSSTTS